MNNKIIYLINVFYAFSLWGMDISVSSQRTEQALKTAINEAIKKIDVAQIRKLWTEYKKLKGAEINPDLVDEFECPWIYFNGIEKKVKKGDKSFEVILDQLYQRIPARYTYLKAESSWKFFTKYGNLPSYFPSVLLNSGLASDFMQSLKEAEYHRIESDFRISLQETGKVEEYFWKAYYAHNKYVASLLIRDFPSNDKQQWALSCFKNKFGENPFHLFSYLSPFYTTFIRIMAPRLEKDLHDRIRRFIAAFPLNEQSIMTEAYEEEFSLKKKDFIQNMNSDDLKNMSLEKLVSIYEFYRTEGLKMTDLSRVEKLRAILPQKFIEELHRFKEEVKELSIKSWSSIGYWFGDIFIREEIPYIQVKTLHEKGGTLKSTYEQMNRYEGTHYLRIDSEFNYLIDILKKHLSDEKQRYFEGQIQAQFQRYRLLKEQNKLNRLGLRKIDAWLETIEDIRKECATLSQLNQECRSLWNALHNLKITKASSIAENNTEKMQEGTGKAEHIDDLTAQPLVSPVSITSPTSTVAPETKETLIEKIQKKLEDFTYPQPHTVNSVMVPLLQKTPQYVHKSLDEIKEILTLLNQRVRNVGFDPYIDVQNIYDEIKSVLYQYIELKKVTDIQDPIIEAAIKTALNDLKTLKMKEIDALVESIKDKELIEL